MMIEERLLILNGILKRDGESENMYNREQKGESWRVCSCYGLHSRALLNPLEAGYLSYYVITLAETPNESCGNLSALWMATSPTTIYQIAPPQPQHTHIHHLMTASVDRLRDMDRACNGIPMLNARLVFFCHLG